MKVFSLNYRGKPIAGKKFEDTLILRSRQSIFKKRKFNRIFSVKNAHKFNGLTMGLKNAFHLFLKMVSQDGKWQLSSNFLF